MGNIIVAFSKPQDGRNIRNILVKHGIQVTASCTSGAQVLSLTDDLRSGIVVSGYRFGDMTCRQLADQLPPGFDLLLIASPSRWSGEAMGRIVCLPAPFKMGDLVSTVRICLLYTSIYSEETLQKIAAILEKKQKEFGTSIVLLSDEPYRELAYDGAVVPYVTKYYRNTVVCYARCV